MPLDLYTMDASVRPAAEKQGFRFGAKGTHTSRTMMLEELAAVLDSCPSGTTRAEFVAAVVEGNCLAKPTIATRKLSCQRISELYALDPAVPVFAVLCRLWQVDPSSRPLLALLCALARDPLLAATLPAILNLSAGFEFRRDEMRHALRSAVGDRMNDSILDKVVRNAASSWTQAGHLEGRTIKRRRFVRPTATAVAYALYLSHIVGFRGMELFSSGWIAILDCSPGQARELALEAKRMLLLDLRLAGDVVEIGFRHLDPTYEGD